MKKLVSPSILVFIAFGSIIAQRVSPYQSGSYYPGLVNLRDLAAAPAYFYAMEQATAFALIPTLELNGKVKDANARPGHRFSLEYGISQYFTSWLEVELVNGHNWQISEDT